MSLEGDIFGDPNATAAEPVKPIADSSGDIFASAVSQPEMKRLVYKWFRNRVGVILDENPLQSFFQTVFINIWSVSLDTPPISPVSVPTPVAAPVMAPVTLSAAPSVPETPVGGGQANDLFNDSDKTSTKKVDLKNTILTF